MTNFYLVGIHGADASEHARDLTFFLEEFSCIAQKFDFSDTCKQVTSHVCDALEFDIDENYEDFNKLNDYLYKFFLKKHRPGIWCDNFIEQVADLQHQHKEHPKYSKTPYVLVTADLQESIQFDAFSICAWDRKIPTIIFKVSADSVKLSRNFPSYNVPNMSLVDINGNSFAEAQSLIRDALLMRYSGLSSFVVKEVHKNAKYFS